MLGSDELYLDSAEQIVAMIDAATALDAKPQARTAGRRALIATLVYAGLRIGEATAPRGRRTDRPRLPTSPGSRRDKDNGRERVIRPVVAHAHELLARRGETPLPDGVSAHKLRHTFASILYVRGEDPPYVMAQLGHTDAGFTLRVYAHAMRRDPRGCRGFRRWARRVPNLRPLACEARSGGGGASAGAGSIVLICSEEWLSRGVMPLARLRPIPA